MDKYFCFTLLETIPIVVGVGRHSWTVICQCNERMTLQGNGMKITSKWLPIDVDLPTICLIELIGIPQLEEACSPDSKEVSKREGMPRWCFDVYHPIVGVRMQPVETRAVRRNADIPRNSHPVPIDVHGNMGMNVEVSMFIRITGDTICGEISSISSSIGRRLTLPDNEIDENSKSQHAYSDDADDRDAFRSGGTLPLFFW